MKEAELEHWTSPNTAADNSSGFTGLPAGTRWYSTGNFIDVGGIGHWWSSALDGFYNAKARGLSYNNSIASPYLTYNKSNGLSVRCLVD